MPRNYATASVNLFNDRINRGLSVPGSEFLIMFFIYYLSKINKLYTYFQPEQKPYSTLPIMYQPFPPYNQFVPQGGPAAPIHYQSQVPPMPHPASNIAPPVQRPTQTEQPKVVVLGKKQIISKKQWLYGLPIATLTWLRYLKLITMVDFRFNKERSHENTGNTN